MQQEIKSLSGEDVFSVAIRTGYGIDYIFTLLRANSQIPNINYSTVLNGQTSFVYDDSFVIPKPPQLSVKTTTVSTDLQESGVQGQTIFDMALQTYGRLEDVMLLARSNNLGNVNDTTISSKTFKFSSDFISDFGFYSSLKKSGTKINTGITAAASPVTNSFLLKEDGFYLLLETGDRIIL